MSYGANLPDQFRRTGDYVDKILRGTKPADIPVEQPTRFDLVVNLITAKTLGLAWTNSPRSPRTGGPTGGLSTSMRAAARVPTDEGDGQQRRP